MKTLRVGSQEYILGDKTYIMGILNVTPDSFSDGGKFNHIQVALDHSLAMVAQGADMIDVGGESTRPSAEPVSLDEELHRVLPVVEKLSKCLQISLSIDTYKSQVAAACLEKGASFINDVWGFQKDPVMADVAAQFNVPAILMHNQIGHLYNEDIMDAMKRYFQVSLNIAARAGVADNQLILDPGIGFGKSFEQNVEVMRRLAELKTFGLPLLLGTSRKSLINGILHVPPLERVNGTLATTVMAVAAGYDIVRVHDVKENFEAAKVADAIYRTRL